MPSSAPTIVVVGSNHEYAPVEVRERLSFSGDQLLDGLDALQRHVPEGLILSTCNRTEVYAVTDSQGDGVGEVFDFLTGYHRVNSETLRQTAYVHVGHQAVSHLFRVAAGLNSMVLGEPQILSQIKDALERARERESIGPMLQRLTLDALRIGKRARTETDIARNRISIAHAAVDLAEQELYGLDEISVTIVGAGEMATLAAKLLRARGVGELNIVNRTLPRAQQLAGAVDGIALPLSELSEAIASSTLVIGAAASDAPIVRREHIAHRNLPLLLVDISVPRVIDQAVVQEDLVAVRDVDALHPIQERYRRDYAREVRKVEHLISMATRDYERWIESRRGVESIRAVRARAELVREAELEKALRKLQHLSDRDQNVVRALAAGLVNKMLHQPIQELRTINDDDERDVVLRAMGVEPGER